MTQKTYICRGLIEWDMVINVNGALVPIHFTGGAVSSLGLIPGRFTTSNVALQHIIERSGLFGRDNKIYIADTESGASFNNQTNNNGIRR